MPYIVEAAKKRSRALDGHGIRSELELGDDDVHMLFSVHFKVQLMQAQLLKSLDTANSEIQTVAYMSLAV